jgi:hypothetical protein
MDLDKSIFEELEAHESGEILIEPSGLPTTLTYHHSKEGKLTKTYQTQKQLGSFLGKFDVIASKIQPEGNLRLVRASKPVRW